MPDQIKEFTDLDGDTIEVWEANRDDGVLSIEVVQGDEDAIVVLDRETALAFLAHAASIVGGDGSVVDLDGTVNETLLKVAAQYDLTVEFRYAKGTGGVIETRRLQPGSFSNHKGNTVIVGYDPDREDVRAYRLDRIKGQVSIPA